ncbi:hypothetical protein LJY25_10080 [Hymenobacter sp. BT175]|uniref:hypothetical protein n=1 Tax=Hymenobacter translucens TaxID=2886507 RepID=UPI001D0E7A0E|nr:hypothetical protein [Hymenobacter translucens]MCC2546791.1 hypothetical protein [Hymenobacter translucens]
MKKILLLAAIGLTGLASCRTRCPAYSSTKPATQISSSALASAETAAAVRQ